MWLPENMNAFAFLYILLGSILVWTGLTFLFFFYYLAESPIRQQKHFFFSLMGLFFGGFIFCSGIVYGTDSLEVFERFSILKGFFGLNAVIVINPFAASMLGLKSPYWQRYFPWLSLSTLLILFHPEWFLSDKTTYHSATLWGQKIVQSHLALKPLTYFFITFCLTHFFIILFLWFRSREKYNSKNYGTWFVFAIFLLMGVNELLVLSKTYHFISFASFAFFGLLILMAVKFFKDMMAVNYALTNTNAQFAKTNEEMQFLVSAISHDTIAPLISIRGFVDLIKEKTKTNRTEYLSETRHYLERIQINAKHVKTLLSELAEYSLIGRITENMETLDLKKVFQEAIEILDLPHQYPGAEVKFLGTWIPIFGSVKHYQQIISNLVINGIRHAKRPDAKITITGQLSEQGFTFCVKDNGPGMTAEQQAKLFKASFRYDPHLGGTGMGLAIVKKMLSNMGGKIWIDTEYQEGTRLCILLPSL